MSYEDELRTLEKKTAKLLTKRKIKIPDNLRQICRKVIENPRRYFYIWLGFASQSRINWQTLGKRWAIENHLDCLMFAEKQLGFARGLHRDNYNWDKPLYGGENSRILNLKKIKRKIIKK